MYICLCVCLYVRFSMIHGVICGADSALPPAAPGELSQFGIHRLLEMTSRWVARWHGFDSPKISQVIHICSMDLYGLIEL